MKFPDKNSKFINNPHLTIARGLDKEKFSRASAEFCDQEYAASFVTRSIVLLKKDTAKKFSKYEVVKEFILEGKSVNRSDNIKSEIEQPRSILKNEYK
jgi:2'-5' RNA ligase